MTIEPAFKIIKFFKVMIFVLGAWGFGLGQAAPSLEEQLRHAALHGDLEQVKTVLKKGKINTCDENGSTTLITATLVGNTEIVKLLLENGANVNAKNMYDETVLSHASQDVLALLLDNGADFNAKNIHGQTVLPEMARNKDIDAMRVLINKGADVNAKTNDGWTALMWGVSHGHPGMVKLLLDHGADPNIRTSGGKTLLMEAVASDHQLTPWYSNVLFSLFRIITFNPFGPRYPDRKDDLLIVKLLLEKGADVNAKDREGETAMKRAKKRGDANIVNLLKKYGAKE
jgi:ankyrin repeat protein